MLAQKESGGAAPEPAKKRRWDSNAGKDAGDEKKDRWETPVGGDAADTPISLDDDGKKKGSWEAEEEEADEFGETPEPGQWGETPEMGGGKKKRARWDAIPKEDKDDFSATPGGID